MSFPLHSSHGKSKLESWQLHRLETELLTDMTVTQGPTVCPLVRASVIEDHMPALRFLWILLARANMCVYMVIVVIIQFIIRFADIALHNLSTSEAGLDLSRQQQHHALIQEQATSTRPG